MINGAQKAGQLFTKATPKIIEKIPAAERPKDVPPPLSKSMQIAETATCKAARVTGFVGKSSFLNIPKHVVIYVLYPFTL